MPKKPTLSIGTKITLIFVVALALLALVLIAIAYTGYTRATYRHFRKSGLNFASTVASLVNGDKLRQYRNPEETDPQYQQKLELIRKLAASCGAASVNVFIPDKDGMNLVYDVDDDAPPRRKPWGAKYIQFIDDYIARHDISSDTVDEDGKVSIVHAPVRDSKGEIAGYVAVEYPLDALYADYHRFLWYLILMAALLTAASLAFCYHRIKKRVIEPLYAISDAAGKFMRGDKERHPFSDLKIDTGDELELLRDSLAAMEDSNTDYRYRLEAANRRAENDSLTKIFNRASLEYRVDEAARSIDQDQLDALIVIDFDAFKEVNDSYGHAKGDEALLALADTLKTTFRASDIVARIGGDEFAVYCRAIGTTALLAEKLEELTTLWRNKRFVADDGRTFSATLSIGAAFAPRDGTDFATLFRNADAALYGAKKNGRDQFSFYND